MAHNFGLLDWLIMALYIGSLIVIGWYFSKRQSGTARDYFLGGNSMPFWVVAVSVLATAQSAATFLGGPDQGYGGDYTYLSTNIGTIIAAIFVIKVLIPRFYKYKVTTVYELLEIRFKAATMRAAGGMYLIGRLFASGSRLYLAAIAVSMLLFSNIEAASMVISSFVLIVLGFLLTFIGGIRSVIWSDLYQFMIYFGSALAVLFILYVSIGAPPGVLIDALTETPEGVNKLRLINTNMNFTESFTLPAILTGFTLLSIGSFGLDQDMTQRVLTCKDAGDGGRALFISAIIAVPVVWVFITIGELLYIFYDRPDITGLGRDGVASREFSGEKITVFMYYILNELPTGMRGLVTAGVVAAAISTINSGLNSMSSVMVSDFYRPWKEAREPKPETYYVRAGQISMGLVGAGLFLMSVLCYYWQRYTEMPLIEFALSVMVFAYSGLLGVYFTILFTDRGTHGSVVAALITGFMATLLQQSYIVDQLHLPPAMKSLAFPWQLCVGTLLAFLVCVSFRQKTITGERIDNDS